MSLKAVYVSGNTRKRRRVFRIHPLHDTEIDTTMARRLFSISSAETSTESEARPTHEEASELVAVLSQCNMGALAVVSGMKQNLRLLQDARLESKTALGILMDSNRYAAEALAREANASL